MSQGMVFLPHCSFCHRTFVGEFEGPFGIEEIKEGAPAEGVLFVSEAWVGVPGRKSLYPTGFMVCSDCQEKRGLKPLADLLKEKAAKDEQRMRELEAENENFLSSMVPESGHLAGAGTTHGRSGLVTPSGAAIVQPGMPAGRVPLHQQAVRRGVDSL